MMTAMTSCFSAADCETSCRGIFTASPKEAVVFRSSRVDKKEKRKEASFRGLWLLLTFSWVSLKKRVKELKLEARSTSGIPYGTLFLKKYKW